MNPTPLTAEDVLAVWYWWSWALGGIHRIRDRWPKGSIKRMSIDQDLERFWRALAYGRRSHDGHPLV